MAILRTIFDVIVGAWAWILIIGGSWALVYLVGDIIEHARVVMSGVVS